MAKRIIECTNVNSRLLKSYGSWLYCSNCNKTVAYICYSAYKWIKIEFTCLCGSNGMIELKESGVIIPENMHSGHNLLLIKNRYCCPNDNDPFFSIVSKQVYNLEYNCSCIKCTEVYHGKIQPDFNHMN